MRSNSGKKFQKKEGLKLEPSKEKEPIICYKCKKLGNIKFGCPQWKKNGSSKQKLKAYVATWSDEDSSNNDDQEVANIGLMAIDETKVNSNTSTSNSYSFDELQDAYDELGLKFELEVSKYIETISKLIDENNSLSKVKHELKVK